LTLWAVLSPAPPAGAATAHQLLQTATQPVFRVGHMLPHLTRWGWRTSFDTRKELCEHWGYGKADHDRDYRAPVLVARSRRPFSSTG
jgi:ribosomal protein L37E